MIVADLVLLLAIGICFALVYLYLIEEDLSEACDDGDVAHHG
jgi:hypothetical protein